MSSKDHHVFHEPRNDVPSGEGRGKLGRRDLSTAGMAFIAASCMTLSPVGQAQQQEQRTRMSRNRATLERYYSALQHKNADELRSAIEEGFAPDAVLRISDSLPYGGTHAGRQVILTMLMGFVTTTAPIIRPEQIKIERMVEEGNSIVAKAVFPWLAPGAREPIPMSAFEWFTFRDGRVVEMVVGYWDTAACLAAMQAAAPNA